MDEIERSVPIFRGGTARRLSVREGELLEILNDTLDTRLYEQLQRRDFPSSLILGNYTDNQTFWRDAITEQHFEGKRIRLQGFHLSEWFPFSPGRYFTPEAHFLREEAKRYTCFIYNKHEYTPLGKESMVAGGIGAVRLKAKLIEAQYVYFLGASSTGISHQGIPVALSDPEHQQVMPLIKQYGGCLVNLLGTLRVISPSLSFITYDRRVPKYCLIVDSVEVIRPSAEQELLTTVAITFACERISKQWSFCSFHPVPQSGNLEKAVDWLKNYAHRYSSLTNSRILSDFDEHYQHFQNPIEFPLQDISKNIIDIDRLNRYVSSSSCDLSWELEKEEIVPEKPSLSPSRKFSTPVKLFISYTQRDETLMSELRKQLSFLERRNLVNIWHAQNISAGIDWKKEIDEHLNSSDIIVLLISPDFISSDYCYGSEMKRALERHAQGEAIVIPVILRPVHWQELLGDLQTIPKDGRPVTDSSWYNQDTALFNVAENIHSVIKKLLC